MSEGNLSLYFKLKEGKKADLEVVAEAALHWVAALRASAAAIDPDSRIRVEFVDAKESSLRLNTILEWMESALARVETGAGKYPRLRNLALSIALFLVTTTAAHYVDDFLDGEPAFSLSDEDRRLLKKLLEGIREAPEVEAEGRKFFRVLERDTSITGVGISQDREELPPIIIPSSEFAERGGLWRVEEDEQERTLRPILDVTLIAPVLLSRPRSWTFQPEGLPEFKAKMKDKRFLAALEHDHVRENLRTGIPMTIRLEVRQKKIDGDWVVKQGGRSVTEVIAPKSY